MENFNPLDTKIVKLEGSNLVEASAGTGKTYSIGLLVLRLLLEKDLNISQILMVTFTNQAVAELAARIRKFLLLGIKAAEGKEVEKPIEQLIATNPDKAFIITKLKIALSQLDEASIQTIHSFCQDALINNALESGQPFGLELQADVHEIANELVKLFWRENISSLPKIIFKEIKEISLGNFQIVVKESLGGKIYAYWTRDFSVEGFCQLFEKFHQSYEQERDHILNQIQNYNLREDWKAGILRDSSSFSGYCNVLLSDKTTRIQISDSLFARDKVLANELFTQKEACRHWLYSKCIKQVTEGINEYLQDKHLITYDELIKRMHDEVVVNKNENLKEKLREKYEAVFIDEFQDTDKLQYEIYSELFGANKILFYIGDPKQSIYGWRKADLNTYFAAREGVEKTFKMNRNFRSSKNYVEDINNFFSGVTNPFETETSGENHIQYISVDANNDSTKGLIKNDEQLSALQTFSFENQDQIKVNVIRLIISLINGPYYAAWNEDKKIKTSDIAILVRYNSQAKDLKERLAREGIPAVTIDDTKVFENASEAKSLLYILGAVLKTTESNINKALLNTISGYQSSEIIHLDKDVLVERFREYRAIWMKSGVFAAIKKFKAHFSVVERLMKRNELRTLTNFNQILELLQEAEFRQQLKPTGVYEYLQNKIANGSEEGDEYLQRVESDENAIKILTIHKAKGLEFPIVIAPFLDLQAKETHNYCSYRDEEGIYKFYPKGKGDADMSTAFNNQLKQENRRLLYVALTRPKYHCFVFENTSSKANNSALKDFIEKWQNTTPIINLAEEVSNKKKKAEFSELWGKASEAEFQLSDEHYGKLSFSALSAHGSHTAKEKLGKFGNEYDEFIFKDIPGGTHMGTMLHYLFENIDFADPSRHQAEVDRLLEKYYPHKKEELREKLVEMVNHVLEAEIKFEDGSVIPLKKLDPAKKLNEMEFDLRTYAIKLDELKGFDAGAGIDINCNMAISTKEGLLNGLIDLFFEYEGKYYILDWKSNYLGDQLENYASGDSMREALNEGNYHLQYFLYSVAVKNYLEARLPGFDYERDFGGAIYIYLRGARKGKDTGIYTHKPSLEQVKALEQIFRKEETVLN